MELIEKYGTPLKFNYLPQFPQIFKNATIGLKTQWMILDTKANIITHTVLKAIIFHIIIERDKNGKIISKIFNEEQTGNNFLNILGYNNE